MRPFLAPPLLCNSALLLLMLLPMGCGSIGKWVFQLKVRLLLCARDESAVEGDNTSGRMEKVERNNPRERERERRRATPAPLAVAILLLVVFVFEVRDVRYYYRKSLF